MPGQFDRNDYIDVDTRISRFWEMHPKPEGSIQTEVIWVREDGNAVAIRATAYMGDRILATGIAHEERGQTVRDGANFTSWWENAETSAIGRALANMDMSLSKKRPSRQEMDKVARYENNAPQPRPTPAVRPAEPRNAPARGFAPQLVAEPPSVLTNEQHKAIADARDMPDAGVGWAAVREHLRPVFEAATKAQKIAIKREMDAIQAKHYPGSLTEQEA